MKCRSIFLFLTFISAERIDTTFSAPAAPSDIVISQIYGGGGNSGAPFRNDFIELFNRGTTSVSISGWTVQYTSATGATWSKADLTGTIAPGRYHLVQLASGGSSGAALPTPDTTGTIAMAAGAGKVALTSSSALLTGSCPASASILDLVGYGSTANCFEGPGPAPAPSNTLAVRRGGEGCTETDNNQADFGTVAANPRNSASPANACNVVVASNPGIPFPAAAQQSDGRAGSVLFYPFYSSSASAPRAENTLLSLTNTSASSPATAHLFFVTDEAASVADLFLCLTPNQTRSFLASDIDPNTAGYLIAIAVDGVTGCPINLNHLIGSEEVKIASGHSASFTASAFAAIGNTPAVCQPGGATAELSFDGKGYNLAPRVLASTSLSSPADGYTALAIITRLGGSLLTGGATIGQVAGLVFNDEEASFSFSFTTSGRQFRSSFGTSFPRTTPRLGEIIPSGRTGWLKLSLVSDGAILGVLLVGHPQVTASVETHAGGGNLHQLSLTDSARLIIPVFPPSC